MFKYVGLIIFLFFSFACLKAASIEQSYTPSMDTVISMTLPTDSNATTTTKKSKNALSTLVDYDASDSIMFDIIAQKTYLYGKAKINYEKITVEADEIMIDFTNRTLHAKGRKDSLGHVIGKPIFTDADKSFTSDSITYNFDTKKGVIRNIITEEGEGFLHGEKVKKLANDEVNIAHGGYTTCDNEHPHFQIKFAKAKLIPNNKIVTSFAYFTLEDIPTPLVLPFGFFPIKKGRASGILIPNPGESSNRGFYLERGGYYLGINDHLDLELRGSIYTNLSWGANAISRYKVRYKYAGNVNINYAKNNFGEKEEPGFYTYKDFKIQWSHSQDAKARPNSSFSANVNAGTNSYNRLNTTNAEDRLSNTLQSNISYSRRFKQSNFSTNLRHSQNTLNKKVSLTLPEITYSVNRFYPFRQKERAGKLNWYENISMSYVMNTRNSIDIADSLLFTEVALQQFKKGMRHTIPISNSMKVLKHFTFTNSFTYNERWYLETIKKTWDKDINKITIDTVDGFKAARDFTYSSALNTMIYGMVQFKKGHLKAVRHVLTPSVSYTYRPNFGSSFWGVYDMVQTDTTGTLRPYSMFEQGIYGSPAYGKSGSVNFSLNNNLEIKVLSKKDTISGTKKIQLIRALTVSSSYDIAKDSLNWSNITLSGSTQLIKNVDIRYTGSWSPYQLSPLGTYTNTYIWDTQHQILRRVNDDWALSANWQISSTRFIKKEKPNPYNKPWNLTINYSLHHGKNYEKELASNNEIVQSLGVYGNVDLSKNWQVRFRTGYDFESKDISYTTIDIGRDLHCWEMSFNWIPFGYYKSYNFRIAAKASLLQDLKFEKKKKHTDSL